MLQAGAMGVPFVPVRGLFGTDLLRYRDDLLVIRNPFNPQEDIVVAPAIVPDVALLHARLADTHGNAVTQAHTNDLLLAQASRRVIVTAEEVVEGPLSPRNAPEGTFIPAIYVTAVVHIPYGAHPTPCADLYGADMAHLGEYVRLASSEEGFREYLERYIFGVKSHRDYLERVGIALGRGQR